ncbi:MAG TPA: FlgD immunoglobulin-like domain containing protein [Gaiellaceae bacterium]|nr:FlgD immunoglobulin-like domain containing protein [Gaiellaceae bacterium]
MARIASTVLVVALLAATAAAFALTEVLKLQKSPITGTNVAPVLSPVCDCATAEAAIHFKLRERDVVDVSVIDGGGDVVATVARGEPVSAGRVSFAWDGRDDAGNVLPEAEYRPRVHLRDANFTIEMPNEMRIDVTAPVVESVEVAPRVFSPDGDGRADAVRATYRLDEEAQGLLFVNGVRRVRTKFARLEGRLDWYGKVDGRALPAGVYGLAVSARDPAGNVAERTQPTPVVIRFVTLGRTRIEVLAGERFGVRVSSDAREVRWGLAGRGGVVPPGTLRLTAPLQKGRFTLAVTANGHTARAAVFVREQP